VVGGVGSSTSGVAAEPFVVSDDSDGLGGVAEDVSVAGADDVGFEDDVVFEDDVSSADDFVVFVPAESLPDDDVLVCVSLSDDVPVPAFELEDFEADEPDPVELLLDDDDPESPLDEAPDPESSACATPVPVASATPSVTAPTPSHL
jgi:hypothetical protein